MRLVGTLRRLAGLGVCLVMLSGLSIDHARGQEEVASARAFEHFAKGGLYDAQNDLLNAIKEYLAAASYDSTSPDIFMALARDYYQLGQREDAIRHAEKAVMLEDEALGGHLILGKCYRDLRLFEQARTSFERVVQLDPNHVEAHFSILQIAEQQNDDDSVLEELEELGRLVPRSADVHFRLADAYKGQGRLDKAAIEYQKVIDDFPTSLRARFELIQIYEQQRKWRLSIEEYRKVVDLNPNNVLRIRQRLGELLIFEGQADQAVKQFKVVLEADKSNPRNWIDLSNAYRGSGQMDMAERTLIEGMKTLPGDASLHAGLDDVADRLAVGVGLEFEHLGL